MSKEKAKKPEFKRVFKGEQEIIHDLYRLAPVAVKRNMGWNPQKPIIETTEHKHFYHNIDSDGKPQTHCGPSLGHTHEVKVIGVNEDGSPKLQVGPAVVLTREKGGKVFRPYKYDQHTHEVEYIQSEVMKPRKYDEEALKSINLMMAKESSLAKSPTE